LNRPLALLVAGTFFMENLDGTIIATAAPAIARDLRVDPVDVNLAMTAYLVTIAVGIPISGWLTDRFGGRRILVTAVALFSVASVLCALSVNLPMLVAMRILQGAGGALMVPVGRLVVLRVTDKRDLLDAIAYLTWPALVAPVIAPALGGWITTVASWHWIFLINAPLGAVALIAALRIVPALEGGRVPPLDWLGFTLCALTLAALLVGLELVGPQGGGGVAPAATLVGAVALGVATAVWFRRAAHPLLRFGALGLQSFRVSNLAGGVYRMVISAVPFLLPLMFQNGFGWSPLHAGIMVAAVFIGNIGIKPATTPLIRRFGFKPVLVFASLASAATFALCALLTPETPEPLVFALLVCSGAFRSIGFSAYASVQYADIVPAQLTSANAVSATLVQLATGAGIAVGALLLRLFESDSRLSSGFGGILSAGPDGSGVAAYRGAFLSIAVLMLLSTVDSLMLHRHAGAEVSRPGPAPAEAPRPHRPA
jgi:EmrB/QacA subfamily drug resistance transporter